SLTGLSDIQALRRCLHALVARHEALRTVFAVRDHRLLQSVQEFPALQFADYDLSFVQPEELDRGLARIVDQERQRPFDLANGPLTRFALLDPGAARHELPAVAHRLVSDETSLAILARELLDCFAAVGAGRRPDLPPAAQLRELALRQRAEAAASGPREDVPDPLDLPFAAPRRGPGRGAGGGGRGRAPAPGARRRRGGGGGAGRGGGHGRGAGGRGGARGARPPLPPP